MPKASVKRLIDNRKDKLVEFVLDIEKYPEFIPFCINSKIYERKDDGEIINIIADLTIGKGPFTDTFKSDVKFDKKNDHIHVLNIEGPLNYMENNWKFVEKGNSYKKVVEAAPDVFNHNIETVPSLYRQVRPGSRYFASLELLKDVKIINKNIFTKSGIMVGLGENKDEILQVMDDLRSADVDFLTIGQYLQPSEKHHPLDRYYKPEEFDELKSIAESKGFLLVSSSPLTRSSYHADEDFTVLKKNRINQTNAQSIS